MSETFHQFNLDDLRKVLLSPKDDIVAEDILLSKVTFNESMKILHYPCRFDGYMVIYCYSGHFKVDINLTTFDVHEGSLFFYLPENMVRVHGIEDGELQDAKFMVLAAAGSVISDMRVDLARMYKESMTILNNPCVTLSEREKSIMAKYAYLMEDIMRSGMPNIRDAVLSLASSAFCLLASIWADDLKEAKDEQPQHTVRSKMIVENFLQLVKEYHASERNVAFYAGKMGLTAKYLSKLVRNVSGRSAPDWIDSFVILEAKNMLKYSDMTIKEIVYRLHFPDQSSFYKFFKSRTGMIPSEYRANG